MWGGAPPAKRESVSGLNQSWGSGGRKFGVLLASYRRVPRSPWLESQAEAAWKQRDVGPSEIQRMKRLKSMTVGHPGRFQKVSKSSLGVRDGKAHLTSVYFTSVVEVFRPPTLCRGHCYRELRWFDSSSSARDFGLSQGQLRLLRPI